MNWSYAKWIIIVLLVIMNMGLLFFRITKDNLNYVLTGDEINDVKSYANKNDVLLYAMLPTEYFPMKRLEIVAMDDETSNVVKQFFGSTDYVNKRNDGNKEIYYKSDLEYVEIYRSGMRKYFSYFPKEYEALTKEEAYNVLKDFMVKVHKGNKKYKPVVYNKENDKYNYIYYNEYAEKLIFNDYIKITIDYEKIEIEMQGAQVNGLTGKREKIIPVNEALFNFVKTIRKAQDYEGENIYILDIQLGYNAENDDLLMNEAIIAEPYYKFSVRYGGDYYINAFTNEVYNQNLIKIEN